MKSAVLALMIGFASEAHWAAAASPSPRCPIIDCKGCCAKNEEPFPGCQWWNECETPVAHCASIKAEEACSADIACRWSTGPVTPVNGTSFIAFDALRGGGCDGGGAALQCFQSESLDALEKWMATYVSKIVPCYDNVTCHCKPEIAWSPLQATAKHMVHAGTCSDCAGLQHYPRPWGGQTSDSPFTPWGGQGSGVLQYDFNSMVTETVVV